MWSPTHVIITITSINYYYYYYYYYYSLSKVYQKLNRSQRALETFTLNQWLFQCNNQKALVSQQSPEDQLLFPCDVTRVQWPLFFRQLVIGIRAHLLKEPEATLPLARAKLRK